MAELRLEAVSKIYDSGVVAVRDVTLSVSDGELLVLVGPSGCGKSTILRMISGLETVTQGRILLGGQVIDDMSESARDIAMIFQNYALYPHLSVYDNIGFPLKISRVPKRTRDTRIREVAETLGLTPQLHTKPGQLSGGQRQRVAMGRAIIREPRLFLMDEPLSNLDAKLRAEMRSEVSAIQHRLGITTVYVTHDQAEAMTLGDRVAVLNKGSLLQVGTPEEIYARPDDLFVAGCLGSPAINLLSGRLSYSSRGYEVTYGHQSLVLDKLEEERHRVSPHDEQDVVVGIRPEAFFLWSSSSSEGRRLTGTVLTREFLGSDVFAVMDLGSSLAPEIGRDLLTQGLPEQVPAILDHVTARFPADASVSEGQAVALCIAPNSLHLFDPPSGAAWARRADARNAAASA